MARKPNNDGPNPSHDPLAIEAAIMKLEMIESCATQFGVSVDSVSMSPFGLPFANPRTREEQAAAESSWEKMSIEVHANQKPLA